MFVQGGDAIIIGGSNRRPLSQVLVILEMNSHSDLVSSCQRTDAKHFTSASNPHVFRKCNFRWHQESDFHVCTLRHRKVGVEKSSARAKILCHPESLDSTFIASNGQWQLKIEALRRSALETNFAGTHGSPRTCFSTITTPTDRDNDV